MSKSEMSHRERMLAALEFQQTDRLPFWPKLDKAYLARYGKQLGAKTVADAHCIFDTDRPLQTPGGYELIFTPGTRKEINQTQTQRTISYHVGRYKLIEKHSWDAPSCSWISVLYPIASVEDIRAMTEFYLNCDVVPSAEAIAACHNRKSDFPDAIWYWNIGQSPLMNFVEWMAGVENAHYLLADYNKEAEALFEAYQQYLLKITRFAAEYIDVDIFYFIENTSTTLISPGQYEAYCVGHILQYGKILNAAGKRLGLHMCGHLKALLPTLAKSPAAVFEAFTSAPVGNTSLKEGRDALPNKCLIGGTNAVTWLKPANEIIKEIEENLACMENHRGLILSSGGVMPPSCEPETVMEVARWIRNYPIR